MSGIAGIIRLDGGHATLAQVDAMLASMSRRGPDRRRGWSDANAALGQVLLATTPEALAETQPWTHPDSGCVVVSDSRLDNRPELLSELGIAYAPPDEIGDGELLHAAWQRWGDSCADRLLGDFVFAIWDPRTQRLFCARDVMGVRPLYYHTVPGRLFAFASETAALLALADVPRDVDEGRIADALVGELEGIDKTSTFYRALVRLPPAHTMWLRNGVVETLEYWHPLMHRPTGLPNTEAEWIDGVRHQLEQAVRRRLRASHRVGSMLSGGLDSSSVVALASELLRADGRNRLPTFSATDVAGDGPETRAIRSMIQSFDIDAVTIDLQAVGSILPALRQRLDEMAEPFDGTMPLIGAIYDAAAARGVRCLLDGMPADNLFTTGDWIHRLVQHGQLARAYCEARDWNRRALRVFPQVRALKSVSGAWAPSWFRRLRQRQVRQAHFKRDLIGATLIHRDFARRVGLWDRYLRYQHHIATAYAWDDSDRAMSSMGAAYITAAVERYGRAASLRGVEPRHPFLDRRLVEFHAWLPLELRARGVHQKWALRQAMSRSLPPDVAWRWDWQHLGFGFIAAVTTPLCEGVAAQAQRDARLGSYVDPKKAELALRAWCDGRDEQAFTALYRAAIVGEWLRRSVSPGTVAPVEGVS